MLEREQEFFQKSLPGWLGKYHGFWALVSGCELIALFPKYSHAISAGHRLFAGMPFLLMEIMPDSGRLGYFRPEKYAESEALSDVCVARGNG